MTAHNPAQVVRLGAVVFAGAASLSLTVAAGAYVVNQMASTAGSGTHVAAPPQSPGPVLDNFAPNPGPRAGSPVLVANGDRSPAVYQAAVYPATPEVAVPQTDSVVEPSRPAGVGGRVGLGTTYVGARVAPVHTNTVAFTVDTNAFSALTDILLSEPVQERLGVHIDPAGITQVRTELDTRSGEITFVLSDANLGEHEVQLQRKPAPADVPAHATDPSAAQPQADAQSQATAPDAGTVTL